MSSTNDEPRSSTENGTTSTESSKNDGVDNGPIKVREFLYLDFAKLTSYYAQIFQGVLRSRQRHMGEERERTVKDTEREAQFELDAAAQAGDASLTSVLAQLLGISLKLETTISHLVKWGGDQSVASQSSQLVEVTELHHDLFALVEKELHGRGLVASGADYMPEQLFHIFKGKADIIDFSQLYDTMKNFKKMGATFKTFTGTDPSQGVANLPQLAEMVKNFYSDKVGIVVTQDGQPATAYIQRDLLTAPIDFIVDTYGRYTQVDLTIFGLRAGYAYPEEEAQGKASFIEGPDAPETPQGMNTMAASLLQTNRAMEGMDRFFRVRGNVQLYPIAIYVDFDDQPKAEPRVQAERA